MKVTEILKQVQGPSFSFEIVPPQRGRALQDITRVVEDLLEFSPRFVDVTSHAAEAVFETLPGGKLRRRIRRKRPGTLGISGIIKHRYKVEPVAHVLCRGFSREESEDALIELNFLGVENVMLLRGDERMDSKAVSPGRPVNEHAVDLVKQVADLRKGRYLEPLLDSRPIGVCIGVAGYPAKHFEAPSLQQDVMFLKQKIEAGADYVVTQMFFNNQHFFRFIELCGKAGIKVPVIPALKVLNHRTQITAIPHHFHVELPVQLIEAVDKFPHDIEKVGRDWAMRQIDSLSNHGFDHIHFFVMDDVVQVKEVLRQYVQMV